MADPQALLRKPGGGAKDPKHLVELVADEQGEDDGDKGDRDPRKRVKEGLWVHGGKVDEKVSAFMVSASLSWSTTATTQLQVEFIDPEFALFKTGLFEKGTALLYREKGALDLDLRITAIDIGPGSAGTGGFTVNARSSIVTLLKRRTGPKVMKKTSPSEFVQAECAAVGAKCVAQESPKRGAVARDVKGKKGNDDGGGKSAKMSSWTTFSRLATELGYYMFEFAGTVYFGKPKWLIEQDKNPLEVALPLPGAPLKLAARSIPSISVSEDSDVPVTISGVELEPYRYKEARPGGAMRLKGLPPYNEEYLITSLTLPLIGTGPLTLEASTPKNPEPQPPAPPAPKPTGGGGVYDPAVAAVPGAPVPVTGGRSGAQFVAIAITASNASYVYGAEASSSDPSPSALDCSELVQWALGRMGVVYVDGSSAQYAASNKISVSQAFATRGALLWKEGHIGISMGDGRSVEARNPSDGVGIFRAADIAWAGGGLVPGLAY